MARPTFQELYGFNSGWSTLAAPIGGQGLFIAESDLFPGGGVPGNSGPDAQRIFLAVMIYVSRVLNEANRNNDSEGIRTTITYGEYDSIIDPPGSTNVFRRDVFSVIAYQPQAYQPFSPDTV